MSSPSTKPGRRQKHEEHEEHVNHERWLITYADMITLLMVLFIVLYSISQVDLAKFEKLKAGVVGASASTSAGAMGGSEGVLDGGGPPAVDLSTPEIIEVATDAIQHQSEQQAAFAAEQGALSDTRHRVEVELDTSGFDDAVSFDLQDRGLVVKVSSDRVLFDVGSAVLRPEGHEVLDALAGPLAGLPNDLGIEGHTDDTGSLAANWSLSANRATAVLRYLNERHGVPAKRLSAAGFADQRPIATNDEPSGRAANRRVEIVVHATVQDPNVTTEG